MFSSTHEIPIFIQQAHFETMYRPSSRWINRKNHTSARRRRWSRMSNGRRAKAATRALGCAFDQHLSM